MNSLLVGKSHRFLSNTALNNCASKRFVRCANTCFNVEYTCMQKENTWLPGLCTYFNFYASNMIFKRYKL